MNARSGHFAAGVIAATVLTVAPSLAQGPSVGCELVNEAQYDGFYGAATTGLLPVAFDAGDELVFAAAEPTGTGRPVERIELREGLVSLVPIAIEPFPGEIRLPITAARSTVFRWRTAPGLFSNQATWTVFCDPAPYCGDGNIDPGEACDDGNNENDDGCGATCFLECGNGVLNAGEECDDGNAVDNDDCTNSCTVPICGDGIVWDQGSGTETCDDGNLVDSDDCTNACTDAVCGDGIVWNRGNGTETCDDGNTVPGDGCDASCQVEAVPTLGEWGVILLVMAVLTAGSLALRRRKRPLS